MGWCWSLTLGCADHAVAYVKYEKASSAAAAIESMHEAVLNDGRGPMLKVLLAEAPNVRCCPTTLARTRQEFATLACTSQEFAANAHSEHPPFCANGMVAIHGPY